MTQGVETDRYRTEWGWSVRCAQCKRTFESKRFDASFCSGKCRTKYNREEKQIRGQIDYTQRMVNQLVNQLDGNYSTMVLNGLRDIRKRLDKAIEAEEFDRDMRRPFEMCVKQPDTLTD